MPRVSVDCKITLVALGWFRGIASAGESAMVQFSEEK